MRLEVGDIEVRPLELGDLKAVKEIRDTSLEYLDTQVSFSLEQMQDWFNTKNPEWYAILLEKEVIGYVRTSNKDLNNKSIYIGMDIHPDYRGNGFAFQVYQEFIDWLKIEGYISVLLRVQVKNFRAYNLYRKLGFMPIGILTDFIILPSGKSLDSILMQKKL